RSVELVEAALSAGGRDVARAAAWRVLRTSRSVPSRAAAPPPLPEQASTVLAEGWVDGYLSAVEWRFAQGRFGDVGPAT
ncbi:thioesterase family protein, partial [Streptomyces galilaeus]